MSAATDGRYEVRAWQVNGVYALFWVPAGGRANRDPDLIFGEARLPMLAAAVAIAIKNPPTYDGGPVPGQRVPADTRAQRVPPDTRGTRRVPPDTVPLPPPDGGTAA